jgi:pimeloyl-ACP methyl ester carboxylesterase
MKMKVLQTKYFKCSDIKMAYTEFGEGHNLLFLHGNSESKRIFRKFQMKYFKNYHSYAIDSRGHGESISEDESYSIEQFGDDVINFCDKNQIKDAFVVGFSDGGNISLFLAKKRPDLFIKIVAISPNYLVSGTIDSAIKVFKKMKEFFVFSKKLGFNTTRMIKRFNLMLKDIGITDDELKSINAKILILYAENDLIKVEHIKTMGNLIPNTKIQMISHCMHRSILWRKETISKIHDYFEQ